MLPIVIFIISAIIPFLLIPSRLQDLLPVTFLISSPLNYRHTLPSSPVPPTHTIGNIATIPVAVDFLSSSDSSFTFQHLSAIHSQDKRPVEIFASVIDALYTWEVDLKIPVLPVLVVVLLGLGSWMLWTVSTTENADRSFITVQFEQPSPPAAISEDLCDVKDEENFSVEAEWESVFSDDGEHSMDLTFPFSSSGSPIRLAADEYRTPPIRNISVKAECESVFSDDDDDDGGEKSMDLTLPFSSTGCPIRLAAEESHVAPVPNIPVKAECESVFSDDDDDDDGEKSMDLTQPFSSSGRPIRLAIDKSHIPNLPQSIRSEADGSPSILTPVRFECDLAITHVFSVTTIPRTILAEDFYTLCELEKQHVVLRGRGLLRYRAIQSRLRCHAYRMELEKSRAAAAARKERQSLSPIPQY